MPRLLAIEWDASEARVAVGNPRSGSVVVEEAFAIDLSSLLVDTSEQGKVGEQIVAELSSRGIAKADTLVALGRSNIELRTLSLPPAPPDELPEMVRFQASRQFTNIGDDWPLDYVPLETDGDQVTSVLAAVISPEVVREITETCESAELTAKHLVLRPFAAASMLGRQAGVKSKCLLMVDILSDEADLTVMADGDVAFMRTVRLPVGHDEQALIRLLMGELRRTIGAAQNQMGGRRVEQITICGNSEHEPLRSAIQQQIKLDTDLFDPFDQVKLGRQLRGERPANPGRYAPLLGMLADEAEETRHAIDLLNPRKKPPPPNNNRRNALVGGLVGAVAVAIAALAFGQIWSLQSDIKARQKAIAETVPLVERAQKQIDDVRAVESFAGKNVIWLDEFVWLANRLPSSDDTILTSLSVTTDSTKGSQMAMDAFATSLGAIRSLEVRLRDEKHDAIGKGIREDMSRPKYRLSFQETIDIREGMESKPVDVGNQADQPSANSPSDADESSESESEKDRAVRRNGRADDPDRRRQS